VTQKYIDLGRQFMAFRDEPNWELSYNTFLSETYLGAKSWTDLLKRRRIAILAEAGSGKTSELREKAVALTKSGLPAFYLTVNDVSARGVSQSLGAIDATRLTTWLEGGGEGVVFLDSVDEARVNGQTFRAALLSLERILANAQQRVTVVISCRVSDWRSLEDKAEFASILGGPPPPDSAETVSAVASPDDTALLSPIFESSRIRLKNDLEDEEEPEPASQNYTPFVVALAPLSLSQARRLAVWDGVEDPDRFLSAVRAADAEDLANRPQDLLALTSYWKTKRLIGSKREILDWSIQQRLRESNVNLGDRDPVSEDEAFYGAKVLAGALTFGQKRFLAWPLETPVAPAADALSINPKDVLPSFSGPEMGALLSRAVFDPATLGRVRFHHRSVQEFLCAQWILDQLNAGCPVRRVWTILAEQKYGETRLRPALRPIAAWLAQLDDRIRRRVLPVAPDLLIEDGDPSILPLPVKKKLLDHFANRYAERNDADVNIGIDQLARLAEPALGVKVQEIWRRTRSGEVRELLLRLIWIGKLENCSGIALRVATTPGRSQERAIASRAIAEIGTPADRKQLAEHLSAKAKAFPKRAIGPALQAVFPSVLDLKGLEGLLRAFPHEAGEEDAEIIKALQAIVRSGDLPDPVGLVALFAKLIDEKPWSDERERSYSRQFWELGAPLLDLCTRMVREAGQNPIGDIPSSAAGRAALISQGMHHFAIGEARKSFAEALGENVGANREQFWFSVAETRSRHGDLRNHWQADVFHDMWVLTERDWDWLIADLAQRTLPNDRLVALTGAIEVWAAGGRSPERLASLRRVIAGNAILEQQLDEVLTPPPRVKTQQDIEWEKERKRAQKRRADEEKVAKKSWVDLRDRLAQDPTKIGLGDLVDLARWLNSAVGRDRYSHSNWRIMIEAFGESVARAARDAFVAFWRMHDPGPEPGRARSMTVRAQVGMIGLSIEAAEDPAWTSRLSEAEVRVTTNYALMEMNGLPAWAPQLWLDRRQVVETDIKREIRWELNHARADNNVHHIISTITYAKDPLRSLAAVWVLDELEKGVPSSDFQLFLALDLVIRAPGISGARLAALSEKGFAAARTINRKLKWLSVWLACDWEPALAALTALIARQRGKAKRDSIVIGLLPMMFEHGSYRHGPVHESFRNLTALRTLTTLGYRHIRRADDAKRERLLRARNSEDAAASARGAVLGMLIGIPGEATYRALREMSGQPEFALSRERLLVLAERRATDDANLPPWTPAEVIAFAKAHEKPPATLSDLDQVISDRLWDIEDDLIAGRFTDKQLLLQDDRKLVQERPVQLEIAKQLDLRSKGAYSVERESENADRNAPDISIQRAGIPHPVPIEIKVGDSWTYKQLRTALESQLIGKYMRSHALTHGHLVLTNHGKKKTWQHPETGSRLDFAALVRSLQGEADEFVRSDARLDRITVTGIDLVAARAKLPP